MLRIPNSAHCSRPWRIHRLVPDFRLEDVWALPTPGGADDFPRLVHQMSTGDPGESSSRLARLLWSIRWTVGQALGWDDEPVAHGGSTGRTLRIRLPEDLREGPAGPEFDMAPFTSLYLLDYEWAAEIVNRTVHGVMHIGWVPSGTGFRGEMAVYVKPNGMLGDAYMAAIRPFRRLIVYPALMRQIEREWGVTSDRRTPSW